MNAAAQNARRAQVYATIRSNPGITKPQLCDVLGRLQVEWHVDALLAQNCIRNIGPSSTCVESRFQANPMKEWSL